MFNATVDFFHLITKKELIYVLYYLFHRHINQPHIIVQNSLILACFLSHDRVSSRHSCV